MEDCVKRRRISESFSVESMSLSSGGDSSEVLDIVTNTSFLQKPPKGLERVLEPNERTQCNSNHVCRDKQINCSPTMKDFEPRIVCCPSPDDRETVEESTQYSNKTKVTMIGNPLAVARLTQELFPSVDPKKFPPWMTIVCPLLARFVSETPPEIFGKVTARLKRHLRIRADGKLYCSLVAAAILRLHPDVRERRYATENVSMPTMLPTLLRERLSCGLFVPMEHVLYGEALQQGSACHVNSLGLEVGPEPYPVSLKESPPRDFVKLIKRSDVLRGMTTHALALGFRFPYLAANMHGLSHHMWTFMFADKMPPAAGIELYDAFFREFEKQLRIVTVMPMDSFPSWLVESVSARYADKIPHPSL